MEEMHLRGSLMPRKVRKVFCGSCIVIYVFATMTLLWVLDAIKSPASSSYSEFLLRSLGGPIAYDDPSLLQYISKEILVPPSTQPYNLKHKIFDIIKPLSSEAFYYKYVKEIFNETRNGFFVEAGALDGETMSNTLWLEQHQGWTGLLVEPDPSNFKALLSKNRKAWAAKACLSIEKYPKVETFSSVSTSDIKLRSMGSIMTDKRKFKGLTSEHSHNSYYTRQCFPLGSLLLALNVTKINLLSLDVEFVEELILRNFDFDKIDIQVLFIEYYTFLKKVEFHEFLISKGYDFIANHGPDIIYVKNGTELGNRLTFMYPVRSFERHIHRPPKSFERR